MLDIASDSLSLSLSHREIKRLLATGQNRYWHQLHADLLKRLCHDFDEWPAATTVEADYEGGELSRKAQHLVHFLRYDINQVILALSNLKNQFSDYSKRYTKAISDEEKKWHIINYAKELGATPRQLRQDERAFERWFGHDAVSDRFQRRYLETERYLSFLLQCLGWMSTRALSDNDDNIDYQDLWQNLALEPIIKPLLDYKGDKRVVISAFNTLAVAIRALPVYLQQGSVSEASIRFIYHSCFGSQSIWVQCEALRLLQSASPESLKVVLSNRLEHPKGNDDLFVRRKVVQIIVEQLATEPDLESLFELVAKDPCPSVRQKLAELLSQTNMAVMTRYYPVLLFEDTAQPVRAAALLSLLPLLQQDDYVELALAYLKQSLSTEKERFVLRTGLHVCRTGLDALLASKQSLAKQSYLQTLLPVIKTLHESANSLAVRRYAGQTSEYLLMFADDEKRRYIEGLMPFVNTIAPGKTRRLPNRLVPPDDAELGRLLSVIAQKDFGFDIENTVFGRFITRGHAFGFRVWRLIHEFRHPSPDKRQAFRHTVGRLFWGRLRVPSAILSELAETKIPGEPLFMDTEDGWRGYLPLVDEVISALALGNKPTYFYHSEGITQLQPPSSLPKRWLASWTISWRFADYARLRNWQEKSQSSSQSYLNALSELGIQVTFNGHSQDNPAYPYQSTDPAVLRFFPAFLPLSSSPGVLSSLWEDFKDYFVSAYENSLYELAVFMTLAMTYFMGRNIFLYRQIVAARNRLPLVLGGWGTRGKSGTERIKAALINALGHAIVSKTTGCEAMFLHSHPFGTLREMFLFRPYDKATIWEQHALVCLADKLKCEVFLWECMGLTPSYVDILQRQWMRDDISTITNTYPDHEDIHGRRA